MLDEATWSAEERRSLAEAAQAYAREILDQPLALRPLNDVSLPYHILDRYDLMAGELFGVACLFLVSGKQPPDTPANIARHLAVVRNTIGSGPVVLLARSIDAHNRNRLIAHRASFVVPFNQLFIPDLTMDLREHYRAPPARPVDHLSPTSQLLLLAFLLDKSLEDEIPSRLALRLKCSAMSMGRAFDELQASALARVAEHGRERRISFPRHGRALWDQALPFLRNPVRKIRRLVDCPAELPVILAGESALACYTSMGEPAAPTYAAPASDLKAWSKVVRIRETPAWDEEGCSLQTWSYDPRALATGGAVDPLSLYLSLRDHPDERVQSAVDELIEGMAW